MSNMEETVNPVVSEHMRTQKKGMLFDIYKKEADDYMAQKQYDKAVKSYNLAIKLQPGEKRALIGRSRCYLFMGKTYRAMQDTEKALSIDASDVDAVYQKAEILFLTGNYQLASVYYKRGHKLDPENPYFTDGIQRSTDALHKFGGGMVAKSKLSAVGDLSFFLNNKRRPSNPVEFEDSELASGREAELPSAGFGTRNHCPLVRISRKPRFPQLASFTSEESWLGESGGLRGIRQEEGSRSALRQPDEDTMKKILGELYGDRQYLQKLQTNLPGGKAERDLAVLTDEGLEFLRERSVFWDTLGPLPPPVPSRRGMPRERTSGALSTDSSATRELPWKRRRKEQTELHRDITQVDFHFRSHLATRQRTRREVTDTQLHSKGKRESHHSVKTAWESERGEWESGGTSVSLAKGGKPRPGRTMFVGFEDPEVDRRRQLTSFVNEELDLIDEAFKDRRYEECLHKAEVCLRAVSSLPEDGINKSETQASLHSCIGNACIALERYDMAFDHHQTALNIGEQAKNSSIVARSLGHMGRMYIIQRKFNKALEVTVSQYIGKLFALHDISQALQEEGESLWMPQSLRIIPMPWEALKFARKAPMCSSLEEVTQTFHEIGNCFLVLGHYDYARDCGKKSLQAAKDAGLTFFEQQAWILIAIAEAKLQHLKESYKAFNGALKVAIRKEDNESQEAITAAMDHLSKKIDKLLRKKSLVNQRMLMRTKTREITQADFPRPKPPAVRNLKLRRPPISRQPTTLTKDMPANQERDQHVMDRKDLERRTRVTAQGVGVVEESGSDDDDDNVDSDHKVYSEDEQTDVKLSQSEKEAAIKIQHSLRAGEDAESLHLHLSHQSLQADDSLPPTERTERDDRLVQTEREDRLDPKHTSRDDRLIQTERLERDEDRRRFRKEATVGSVNVDDSMYQQYARETSFNKASTLRAKHIYVRQSIASRQSLASRHAMASRQGMLSRQSSRQGQSRQAHKHRTKKKTENASQDEGQQAMPDTDRGTGDGSSEPDLLMAFHPLPPITPRQPPNSTQPSQSGDKQPARQPGISDQPAPAEDAIDEQAGVAGSEDKVFKSSTGKEASQATYSPVDILQHVDVPAKQSKLVQGEDGFLRLKQVSPDEESIPEELAQAEDEDRISQEEEEISEVILEPSDTPEHEDSTHLEPESDGQVNGISKQALLTPYEESPVQKSGMFGLDSKLDSPAFVQDSSQDKETENREDQVPQQAEPEDNDVHIPQEEQVSPKEDIKDRNLEKKEVTTVDLDFTGHEENKERPDSTDDFTGQSEKDKVQKTKQSPDDNVDVVHDVPSPEMPEETSAHDTSAYDNRAGVCDSTNMSTLSQNDPDNTVGQTATETENTDLTQPRQTTDDTIPAESSRRESGGDQTPTALANQPAGSSQLSPSGHQSPADDDRERKHTLGDVNSGQRSPHSPKESLQTDFPLSDISTTNQQTDDSPVVSSRPTHQPDDLPTKTDMSNEELKTDEDTSQTTNTQPVSEAHQENQTGEEVVSVEADNESPTDQGESAQPTSRRDGETSLSDIPEVSDTDTVKEIVEQDSPENTEDTAEDKTDVKTDNIATERVLQIHVQLPQQNEPSEDTPHRQQPADVAMCGAGPTPEKDSSAVDLGTPAERETCQPAEDFPSRSQTVASWVQAY